jgi:hypothetical protein
MAKGRKRFEESPQTKTADLHGYLLEEAPDKRVEAANSIFDQCRALIGNITEQLLRSRFESIAEDSIQEAWSDCLSELQERRAEFLKDRAERPGLREMACSRHCGHSRSSPPPICRPSSTLRLDLYASKGASTASPTFRLKSLPVPTGV